LSFNDREISRQRGKPVTLYFFRYGDGPAGYFAYTDAETEITGPARIGSASQVLYAPIPIQRGSINSQGTLDKAALEIRMPAATGLAEQFRLYAPSRVVTLIIRQGHLNDPDNDFPAVWAGRIINASREGVQAKFLCEPISTSLRRTGLRRNYQYGCPHALYGAQCKADKDAATKTKRVDKITSGNRIAFTTDLANFSKYRGGLAAWTTPEGNTELRTIIAASATAIRVNGIILGLAAGDTVDVSFGCNHTMDDCQNLFNNLPNYGGQPWIPTQSPLGTTNLY
jgi:uncharacterized phage protein (TIGR02218 family)